MSTVSGGRPLSVGAVTMSRCAGWFPLLGDLTFSMFARMMLFRRLAALALVLFASAAVQAQTTSEAGVFAGGAFNIHSASFARLGTFRSCCPEFTSGSGIGWYAGGWYGWQLSSSLSLLGRGSLSSEAGRLSDQERSFVADLRDTARVVDALFQHDLDATLLSIGIEPLLAYRLGGSIDLLLGARAGLVLTRSFHQTETLTEPADYGSYLGDDRVWVDTQADIPNASTLRLTAVAGMRYVLPVGRGRKSFLAPELTVHVPLTGVASGVSWSVAQVRLGIALGWSIDQTVDTIPTPPRIQAPPSPPPVIAYTPPQPTITIEGIDVDGTLIPALTVRVEQTQVTTLHPMLGHIYFDAGASTLPERYREGILRAQQDTLRLQPREALHAELFVIAKRLVRVPSARVLCTGTTAGTTDDQGIALARARAEAIRDVLASLGVSREQIDVQTRATPQRMTSASDTADLPMAIAENRRVEITTSTPSILAPLSLGTIDVDVTPMNFRVSSTITSALPITSAVVELRHGNRLLATADHRRPSDRTLDVGLSQGDVAAMTDAPIIATIAVQDSIGQTGEARAMLLVEVSSVSKKRIENLGDTQIERYQLILFDFNDVTVSGANAKLLSLIRSRITPTTQVRIIGATDVLGSSEYNADLSLRRAREVARQLQVPAARVTGSGEIEARFDNTLPEGRAYNRTVIVELINTVK